VDRFGKPAGSALREALPRLAEGAFDLPAELKHEAERLWRGDPQVRSAAAACLLLGGRGLSQRANASVRKQARPNVFPQQWRDGVESYGTRRLTHMGLPGADLVQYAVYGPRIMPADLEALSRHVESDSDSAFLDACWRCLRKLGLVTSTVKTIGVESELVRVFRSLSLPEALISQIARASVHPRPGADFLSDGGAKLLALIKQVAGRTYDMDKQQDAATVIIQRIRRGTVYDLSSGYVFAVLMRVARGFRGCPCLADSDAVPDEADHSNPFAAVARADAAVELTGPVFTRLRSKRNAIYWKALVLKHVERLELQEIASMLEVSPRTVSRYLRIGENLVRRASGAPSREGR